MRAPTAVEAAVPLKSAAGVLYVDPTFAFPFLLAKAALHAVVVRGAYVTARDVELLRHALEPHPRKFAVRDRNLTPEHSDLAAAGIEVAPSKDALEDTLSRCERREKFRCVRKVQHAVLALATVVCGLCVGLHGVGGILQ